MIQQLWSKNCAYFVLNILISILAEAVMGTEAKAETANALKTLHTAMLEPNATSQHQVII